MIEDLHIENYALIDRADISFTKGFNVITGETGAGKSVLVTAVSTVLGDRADTSMVRTGSDRALIQIAGEKNGEEVIISRNYVPALKQILKGGES